MSRRGRLAVWQVGGSGHGGDDDNQGKREAIGCLKRNVVAVPAVTLRSRPPDGRPHGITYLRRNEARPTGRLRRSVGDLDDSD